MPRLRASPIEGAGENDLLFLLARTEPGAEDVSRIRTLVRGPMDWDRLFRSASVHRVIPLVYRNLKTIAPLDVPPSLLARLRDAHLRNAAHNLRLAARLKEICRLLHERGIEAVPFKGPVLAQEVFGDIGLRQFTDLDLLVPRAEAWHAVQALEERGYAPEIRLTGSQFRSYALRNKSLPLSHLSDGVFLDLHWDLSGDYALRAMTMDAFRKGLEPVTVLGQPLFTLGRDDLVAYLCLHATMESWSRLDHVCCVAELVRKHPDVLGAETYEKAKRMHLKRCLLAGCWLIYHALDAPVPQWLLDEAAGDGHVSAYVRECHARLLAGGQAEEGKRQRPKFSIQHMRLKDGPGDRFRHMLFLLLSPTIEDWRRLPVPGRLGWILYGYRPLRLGMDFLRERRGGLGGTAGGRLTTPFPTFPHRGGRGTPMPRGRS